MVIAYSMDMRERVARAVVAGGSVRAVAARFEVSISSAVRWSGLSRKHGNVSPRAQGRPAGGGKLASHMDFLEATLKATPDVTMPELAERLLVHTDGFSVHPASLSRFLCKAGYTYKKTTDGKRTRTRLRHRAAAGLDQ